MSHLLARGRARPTGPLAIYGTDNGRINIAGLRSDQIDRVAQALAVVSRTQQAA